MCPPEAGVCGTYHVYHVDKVLSIVPRESLDHLDLIAIQEDGHYERDAIMRGNSMADQPFPGRRVTSRVTTHKNTVRLMDR